MRGVTGTKLNLIVTCRGTLTWPGVMPAGTTCQQGPAAAAAAWPPGALAGLAGVPEGAAPPGAVT